MSAVEWRPLSARLRGDVADLAWREEVPAALEEPLRKWVDGTLAARGSWGAVGVTGIPERVLLRLDLVLPDAEDDDIDDEGVAVFRSDRARRFLAYQTPVELLPDVVDAVLYLWPVWDVEVKGSSAPKASGVMAFMDAMARSGELWPRERRRLLAELLADALSVLRVRSDGRGLERRSDAVAEAAFVEAVKGAAAPDAGSAAAHLRAAWGCVHALHPDPGKAYAEAIKAVEAAAHALVEPNNTRATLGTMIGQLRSNPSRFSLTIGEAGGRDAAPLVEFMSVLWEGQTSRHGSSAATRVETIDEAAAAVHLAVMLVQWFTSGVVQRR